MGHSLLKGNCIPESPEGLGTPLSGPLEKDSRAQLKDDGLNRYIKHRVRVKYWIMFLVFHSASLAVTFPCHTLTTLLVC